MAVHQNARLQNGDYCCRSALCFFVNKKKRKLFFLLNLIAVSMAADDWNKDQDLKDLSNAKHLNKLFGPDGYFKDTRQEEVRPFGGTDIKTEAQKLSANLRWLSNEEMGVTEMQGIYDGLPYTDVPPDYRGKLQYMTETLQNRFKNYLQIVQTNKLIVQNLYKYHLKQPITQKLDCCSLNATELRPDNQYRCPVSKKSTCDLIPYSLPFGAFNPGRNLTKV